MNQLATLAADQYLRVSYSSLNVLENCDRKFEFHKLYPRKQRTGDDFFAAEVGKALHAGEQNFMIHGDREEAIWAFMQAFPFALEFNQPNDFRGFDASLSTLEEMMDSTGLDDYELAQFRRPNTPAEVAAGLTGGLVVPAIEVPFEIRFNGLHLPDGRGLAFIGYIDAIVRHRHSGRFRTCDIKTSRVNVEDATAKYKYDDQQVPYGLIVDHIAEGVVDSFDVLYYDCYIDLAAPRVKLYEFSKTRQDILEWVTNKALQFQRIIRYAEMDYFPRTGSGCLFYNKPCIYLEPCQSRSKPDLTQWFLEGQDAAPQEEFFPWVVADIDVGA